MIKNTFLILLVLFFTFNGIAQEVHSFKQLSFEQGLPFSNLRWQIQDQRGVMWFAIEAMGICRFDGHKFQVFSNKKDDSTSISSNYVNNICEDTHGYLWIATDDGLNRYDYKTGQFKSFFYNKNDTNSLPDNLVFRINKDKYGNLWVGTSNGFAMLDPKTLTFKRFLYKQNSQKNNIRVYQIVLANDGDYWVGTNQGLIKYNIHTRKYKLWNEKQNGLLYNSVIDIIEDDHGKLWIATSAGMDKLDIQSGVVEHVKYSQNDEYDLQNAGINDLYMEEGKVWVATSLKGILVFDTKNGSYDRIMKSEFVYNSLRSDHIRYFYKDRNDLFWVGSKFGGVFKYIDKTSAFNYWPEKYKLFNNISSKYILGIFEDSKNIFWVSTKFSGIYKLNLAENTIINYQHKLNKPTTLASNRVRGVLRDSKNRVWLATGAGLDLLNENTNEFTHISTHVIGAVYEDVNGNVWVGTNLGLFILDEENYTLTNYKRFPDQSFFNSSNFDIYGIYGDREGNVYFSTRYKGVFILNEKEQLLYNYSKIQSPETEINANMIRPVFQDDIGQIWMGTKESGLKLLDKENNTFTSYDVNSGLPSNMVLSIQQDLKGNIWLGTNNGISKFDIQNKSFTNFNQDYGLKTMVCEQGAVHRFKDGALLFGGNYGFNIFYPEKITEQGNNSPMLITSVKVFEESRLRDVSTPKSIVLSHKENYLSFEFILTDYNKPNKHQFKCFMQGVDENWRNLGNRNFANYTNLSPGNYTFYVDAANEMGKWKDSSLYLDIKILKPWWGTWLFRILAAVFVIGIIMFIYYLRVKQIKYQKNELERQVNDRTQELNETNTLLEERQQSIEEQAEELKSQAEKLCLANEELIESNDTKDKLFSIIAHDLKNPFNTVLGFSELLLTRFDRMDSQKLKDIIKSINGSTKNIYNLLENLLSWSRSQSGTIDFKPVKLSVSDLVSEDIKLLAKMIEQKNIDIEIDINKNHFVYADPNLLNTVVRNLLTNAIKFTENGKIYVRSLQQKDVVKIEIEDTGVGMTERAQKEIFKIGGVKSSEGTRGEAGTGLGLIVCKEFIEVNKGSITVSSELGKGSVFTVTLPGF